MEKAIEDLIIIGLNSEKADYNTKLYVLNKYPKLLKYVEQTHDMCLEIVKQNGWVLENIVRNPTSELCLEAVKYNGMILQYVKNQTEEICMEAVKQDGMSLQFVKDQTEEICLEAVKQNECAINYVIIEELRE